MVATAAALDDRPSAFRFPRGEGTGVELPERPEPLEIGRGRIVAEVLVGLLQRDPSSYLYLDPAWKPMAPIAPATGQFGFVDLLRFAGVA